MDKAQRKALSGLSLPSGLSVDAATGFVYREGWPRPGLRLEPVSGRFTVRVCSFRVGGWTPSEVVKVGATADDVARALGALATLPVTRTGFRVWARVVSVALWSPNV